MIMINFKKAYGSEIIAIVLSITFFSTPPLYPSPASKEDELRVPSFFQDEDHKRNIKLALILRNFLPSVLKDAEFKRLWNEWIAWQKDPDKEFDLEMLTKIKQDLAERSNNVPNHVQRTVKLMAEYIQGPRVVDVGAGTGRIASLILKSKKNVTNITATGPPGASEFRVSPRKGLKLFAQKAYDTLRPIRDHSVNTVIFSYVLHHTDEKTQRALLKEAYRILVPGGRVIIIEDTFSNQLTPENNNKTTRCFDKLSDSQKFMVLSFLDRINNIMINKRKFFPFTFKSMEEWEDLFRELGFSIFIKRYLGSGEEQATPHGIFVLEKGVGNIGRKITRLGRNSDI